MLWLAGNRDLDLLGLWRCIVLYGEVVQAKTTCWAVVGTGFFSVAQAAQTCWACFIAFHAPRATLRASAA